MSQAGMINTSGGGGGTPAAFFQNTVVMTSAQVKALAETPITIVPAQGTGMVVLPLSVSFKLDYGGTNAFVNGGAIDLAYYLASGPTFYLFNTASNIFSNTLVQATANTYGLLQALDGGMQEFPATQCENLPVVITNQGADITGNAAGNNTITVVTQYLVLSIP
jgi:hypothetical protein